MLLLIVGLEQENKLSQHYVFQGYVVHQLLAEEKPEGKADVLINIESPVPEIGGGGGLNSHLH